MQQFYGVGISDPALYHVVLDSTSIDVDGCVEIIARAARSVRAGAQLQSANGPAR